MYCHDHRQQIIGMNSEPRALGNRGRRAFLRWAGRPLFGAFSLAVGSRRASAQAPQRAYLIPLVLTPYGFEPREITMKPARVVLAVYNRSGLKEPSFTLDWQPGDGQGPQRINQGRLRVHERKWRNQLILAPGTYIVREENHSQWTCQITVKP